MVKNSPVAPPVSRFRPDLGLYPSGEPRPSPAPWGALGNSGRNECAGTSRKVSARLVAPTCRRESPVIVLIASSSAHRRLPRILPSARYKSLRPTDVNHASATLDKGQAVGPPARAASRRRHRRTTSATPAMTTAAITRVSTAISACRTRVFSLG
jgi:hypothetical protein